MTQIWVDFWGRFLSSYIYLKKYLDTVKFRKYCSQMISLRKLKSKSNSGKNKCNVSFGKSIILRIFKGLLKTEEKFR